MPRQSFPVLSPLRRNFTGGQALGFLGLFTTPKRLPLTTRLLIEPTVTQGNGGGFINPSLASLLTTTMMGA